MFRFIKISLVTFLLTLSAASHSGILIDPYLGYRVSGSGDFAGADLSYNGPAFGTRVGYTTLGLMLGLDFTMSTFDLEFETANQTFEVDTTSTSMGAFIGYSMPFIRGWATYYFSQTFKTNEGPDNGDKTKGSGFGLGLGYTGFPIVSLNLEYRKFSFDEQETAAGVTTSIPSNVDVDASEILFTVSIPFSF